MESTLVVKVTCGDTLRRFKIFVADNGKLGLNLDQLKEKMYSLFNLPMDDEFTLTYTDTDGDSVTIIEECDLDDMVSQRLNPIRMVLTLKTSDKSSSYNVSSSQSFVEDSCVETKDVEATAKEIESEVSRVPEFNHAPPPPTSGFEPTTTSPYIMILYTRDLTTQLVLSRGRSDRTGLVSHATVLCDGCNMHPIVGQRFKSKVRDNYDLCNLCYLKYGNEADYVRIDSPMRIHVKMARRGEVFKLV